VGRPFLALLCVVRSCAITACLSSRALGTYVSVLLAIEALLELAASIVVFALLHRRLDNETLLNSHVRVFGFSKLDDKGGSFLFLFGIVLGESHRANLISMPLMIQLFSILICSMICAWLLTLTLLTGTP
jgi:hypothetical protein